MENNLKKIVEFLTLKGETISIMESCTGGGFVNEITNIEGASEVLKFSCVTYSNEYKIKMGVDPNVIDQYSVYSIETSREMSKKISEFTNSTYGVGITGKLNRIDRNNLTGEDNKVFISIYDSKNNKYYDYSIDVNKKLRKDNKKDVINLAINNLFNILINNRF